MRANFCILGEPQGKGRPRFSTVCGHAKPRTPEETVLYACLAAPQHRYLFLTKNPKRYLELDEMALLPLQGNFWYGSTVTSPSTDYFTWSYTFNTFASIEPLLEPFGNSYSDQTRSLGWVIIGAETGNRKGKVIPDKAWVQEIQEYCRENDIPVFMKDSLIPIMGEAGMVREFPWEGGCRA